MPLHFLVIKWQRNLIEATTDINALNAVVAGGQSLKLLRVNLRHFGLASVQPLDFGVLAELGIYTAG